MTDDEFMNYTAAALLEQLDLQEAIADIYQIVGDVALDTDDPRLYKVLDMLAVYL